MKPTLLLFMVLFPILVYGQNPEKPFYTIDNISLRQKVYTVQFKQGKTDFKLMLRNAKDSTTTTQSLAFEISGPNLSQVVINTVRKDLDTDLVDSLIADHERNYLILLKEKITQAREREKEAWQRNTEAVDNTGAKYSGVLKLMDYISFQRRTPIKTLRNDTISGKKPKYKIRYRWPSDTSKLKIKKAFLQFFNNKASTVFIQAELNKGSTSETINFINDKYSIPMRAFNRSRPPNFLWIKPSKYTLSGQTQDGDSIKINLNDVFDYQSYGAFNYSVANLQYELSHESKEKTQVAIEQRRFFDFFTAVIYTDLMGANSDNSNSLLNAQTTLLVPMNQRSWGKIAFTRQFLTSVNMALGSSFNNDSRYISVSDDNPYIEHFDLFKKNNLNARISLDLLTYESKGWFLNTSLGYSAAFYRTGIEHRKVNDTGQDTVAKTQLFSTGVGPYLNFEIRPQSNFGADVNLSLKYLAYNDNKTLNGLDIGEIIEHDTYDRVIFKHNMASLAANFYWLTNPQKSSGGVYARIGTTYHLATRTVFPQIFVGYATNLTSFVNRFKSHTKPNPDQP